MGQAIFYEMFGDPISNPHGYKTEELGSVSDVRDGTHDSPKYVEEAYPLLTSKNFTSGKIVLQGANQISKRDYANINKRSKVDIGDIVMPMIGASPSNVILLDSAVTPLWKKKKSLRLSPKIVLRMPLLTTLLVPRLWRTFFWNSVPSLMHGSFTHYFKGSAAISTGVPATSWYMCFTPASGSL